MRPSKQKSVSVLYKCRLGISSIGATLHLGSGDPRPAYNLGLEKNAYTFKRTARTVAEAFVARINALVVQFYGVLELDSSHSRTKRWIDNAEVVSST